MPHRDLRQSLAMRSGYLACLFLVGSAMSGQSQSPQLLQVAECRTCAIQATKTASIGEAGGYELSLRPFGVTRAMDGTVWVLEQGKATPTVFNSRGRFLRDVGRSGGGPGGDKEEGDSVPRARSPLGCMDHGHTRAARGSTNRLAILSPGQTALCMYWTKPSIGARSYSPTGTSFGACRSMVWEVRSGGL